MYIPLVMSVFCNDMSFCNFALPPLSICGLPTQISFLCELVRIGDDNFSGGVYSSFAFSDYVCTNLKFQIKYNGGSLYLFA